MEGKKIKPNTRSDLGKTYSPSYCGHKAKFYDFPGGGKLFIIPTVAIAVSVSMLPSFSPQTLLH